MGSNGSFYQGGLPLSGVNTGVGNVPPGAPAPKTAESSFYLGGSVYATLLNSDALLAAIEADLAAAEAAAAASQASNVASGASAASSAASAAAAAAYLATLNSTALLQANNLSDLPSVPTAKINLALVKADVGLGSVDNTSDASKPVSTAQATAIGLKANTASPTFTGVPAAPTATPGTNTTQLASTAFVEAARVILVAADALKAPLASPALTGTPTAPTAAPATSTTQLATTAFVEAARVILAAADALKAPIASPTFTGTPAAPTAAPGTGTTQLATTAFVEAARVILAAATALKANTASPALTGTPTAPTATVGTNTTQLATTAFVLANAGGVAGPGSSTDNAAVRFDATSGALIQNSALLISDTTGALSRSGGGGIPLQGRNTNTPAAAGDVGEIISAEISFAGRVAAGTSGGAGIVWHSINLTPGVWLVGGNCGTYLTAGTLTHMHADHSTGTTLLTAPGGGATTATHTTANHPNGYIFPLGVKPYFLSANTTISSVATCDYSGGSASHYGFLWALRIC